MPSDPLKPKTRGRPRKDGNILPPEVIAASAEVQQSKMTDKEVLELIQARFEGLSDLIEGVANGENRAVIVSGAPGIGKTHTSVTRLQHLNDKGKIRLKVVKGFMTATMLYQLLWENKDDNCVIVVDDCDDVFRDDTAVNILKAALDTSEERLISYRSMNITAGNGDEDGGTEIPNEFIFNGSMIFNTNIDFVAFIAGPRTKATPHIEALLDRALYLDMKLHGPRALSLWVNHMLNDKKILLGNPHNLTPAQSKEVVEWLMANRSRIMPQMSLRSAVKAATLVRTKGERWTTLAEMTMCK